MTDSIDRRQELKSEFVRTRGYWTPALEGLLALDPVFFESYLRFSELPWKRGVLAPKVKELVHIGLNASGSHLREDAIHAHIRKALDYGATREEILDVLELVSVLGIHSITVGMPILVEELRRCGRGHEIDGAPMTPDRRELKEKFSSGRGYWNSFWDGLLALDPEFLQAYLKFSTVPFRKGNLDPKTRELVYIAIDASATHLYAEGLRIHFRGALEAGASTQEILEVLELISELGIQSCTVGVPILLTEYADHNARNRGQTL